jgi:tRNA(adenine34) deaminase
MEQGDVDHEARIERAIRQLRACRGDYRGVHEELDRRRQAWWEETRESLELSGPLPRQAYTMFLLRHLGLDPAEAPVVYENERTIVWRSFNFCSTLEACLRLGLDTRQVCREGTEASVQRLIARLDARLTFSRNYEAGLRPYAPYCEERIDVIGPGCAWTSRHFRREWSF